jgi:cation:H+ antiporter
VTPGAPASAALGSNTLNVMLVLGLTAFLRPMQIKETTARLEVPIALLAALVVLILANDGFIEGALARWQGAVMLAGYLIYIFCTLAFQ